MNLVPRRVNQHQVIASHASIPPTSKRAKPNTALTWRGALILLASFCLFFLIHARLSLLEDGTQLMRLTKIPKRVLVFGSHHTGTSVVTKLLMDSGCKAGNDLVMLPGNELKYFEDRETVDLNRYFMAKGRGVLPRKGPKWVNFGFKWNHLSELEKKEFIIKAKSIARRLDDQVQADSSATAWVLKDPRMSMLAEQWLAAAGESAVCVLVIRDPLETSIRMERNYRVRHPKEDETSLTLYEWIAVWEESMTNAARACLKRKSPIVFAYHADLIKDPLTFAQTLERDVFRQSTETVWNQEKIDQVLGKDFSRNAKAREMGNVKFSFHTERIWNALQNRDLSPLREMAEAYATIVTGNDRGFVSGALALAASIRKVDSTRDMVAMLSVEVNDPTVSDALEAAGWKITRVQKLPEPWYGIHPKCDQFTDSQSVRWGRMFSKLRVYSLPYDRVLYLDTDTMVLRDVNSYFNLPDEFYAERSPSHLGINAGIMLVRPNKVILDDLLYYAKHNEPLVFWPSNQVGCTEQELLNRFWNGKAGFRKLNDTRHFDYLTGPFVEDEWREEIRTNGARLSHCLTTKCQKPWDVQLTALSTRRNAVNTNCDKLMYYMWHRFFRDASLQKAREVLFPKDDNEENRPVGLRDEFSDNELDAYVLKYAKSDNSGLREDWRRAGVN